METLVAVAREDQFCNRNRGSRNFRDINCRTFHSGSGSGVGMLRSPSDTKRSLAPKQLIPSSPKTPSVTPTNVKKQYVKKITKSNSVPIPLDVKRVEYAVKDSVRSSLNDSFFYSELWAGPAYSNSPPPSSLPIPKFSVKPKRTVSLKLPLGSSSAVDLLALVAKSAPCSPTREHQKGSSRDFFRGDDEFATKTLRRILNLDE